jgi:hypothetical protein
MNPLLKKLNYKDQPQMLVINAPDSFQKVLNELGTGTRLSLQLDKEKAFDFIMAFVRYQEEINHLAPLFNAVLEGDGLLWFAYPKASSKKYQCNFNRDTGWAMLGSLGFEPVRQVAIDEDWSALRFRRVAYIKKMSRRKDMAISEVGKKKTKGR